MEISVWLRHIQWCIKENQTLSKHQRDLTKMDKHRKVKSLVFISTSTIIESIVRRISELPYSLPMCNQHIIRRWVYEELINSSQSLPKKIFTELFNLIGKHWFFRILVKTHHCVKCSTKRQKQKRTHRVHPSRAYAIYWYYCLIHKCVT